MSTYGRNFEFRVPPVDGQRAGRFSISDATAIGAPVGATGSEDALGRAEVDLVTGATTPRSGKHGVLVYEFGPAAYAGDDAALTTYSDKDTAPAGAAVQVVSGTTVKVVFRNTEDRTFLNTRSYDGKVMVAGIGIATPTLAAGDYLTPGTGDSTSGYWAETADVTKAWFIITKVDNDRGEVEARMMF